MTYSFNPKYSLLLLSLTLAAGSVAAGTESAFSHQVGKDQIYAEMVAEVERDSQGFTNSAANTQQLRYRVRELDGNGSANKARTQNQHQHKTMNQYQHQRKTGNNYSQPMNSSGSMNRGGGNRGGGGGGGGRR